MNNTILKNIIKNTFIFLCCLFLVLFIKGDGVIQYFDNTLDTRVGGPFETSGSTARYALTQAIVENHSLFFTLEQAKFASPDVSKHEGKYFSTFMPLISFIGVPFYYIGEKIGFIQISTYLVNILAGILNLFLIIKISAKLGCKTWASTIAGAVFLFATNVLNYSLGFTQHNVSTAILLLIIVNFQYERGWFSNILLGGLIGLGVLVDVPNLILVLPIVLTIAIKTVEIKKVDKTKERISFKLNNIGYILGLIPMLGILFWYNASTTGSPIKLAQTIGRTHEFAITQPIQDSEINTSNQPQSQFVERKFSLPFDSRLQLDGFYVLILSNERSWLVYSPVVLFGLLGIFYLLRDKEKRIYGQALLAIILINIILYSMFGDPYGGWAFGPRYLIPGASIMCIGVAVWLSKRQNVLVLLLFYLTLIYSIFVNVLGALTTSVIPPKTEAIHLSKPIPYTYQYNWNLINDGTNSSLVYNVFFKNRLEPIAYFYIIFGLVVLLFIALNFLYIKYEKSKK